MKWNCVNGQTTRGQIPVFNKIYEQVFNQQWLQHEQRKTLKDNSYLRLSAFQVADAERFLGRKPLTQILYDTFQQLTTASPNPRLLAIIFFILKVSFSRKTFASKGKLVKSGWCGALSQQVLSFNIHRFVPDCYRKLFSK